MTDLRALLKRLEWAGRDGDLSYCMACRRYLSPSGHAPDCELAAALAEPREMIAEAGDVFTMANGLTATVPKAGVYRVDGKSVYYLGPVPVHEQPAPHVKVTEVVGQVKRGYPVEGARFVDHGWDGDSLDDLVPREAAPDEGECGNTGPRGRFRVTVEFWPDDKGKRT